MKKTNFYIFRLFSTGLILIASVALIFYPAAAAGPKRIALLPFKINSEKDLSFLKDGIFDMLSTRLAKEGQVEVLGRTQVEAAMQSAATSATAWRVAARGRYPARGK